MVFLMVYVIVHGGIKVGLVYCLLRKYHQAYPIALVVLAAFLGAFRLKGCAMSLRSAQCGVRQQAARE